MQICLRRFLLTPVLLLLLLVLSCEKNTTEFKQIEADAFWTRLAVPDGITFTGLFRTPGGTLLAPTGDFIAPAVNDGFIYRSTDNGATWTGVDVEVDAIFGLADYGINRILAATNQGLYTSSDEGQTWNLSGLDTLVVRAVAGYFQGNDHIILAGTNTAIFQSTDDGATWTRILDTQNTGIITALAILSPSHIFAGIQGGISSSVLVSSGAGQSWNTALAGFGLRTIFTGPDSSLYIGGGASDEWSGGLMQSTDGGVTWTRLLPYETSIRDGLFDPEGNLYVCGYTTGVQFSADGHTWQALNDGLGSLWVTGLALDAEGYLYAATDLGGIFKSLLPIQ